MKRFCIIILLVVLISCVSKGKEDTNNNEFLEIDFNIGKVQFARFNNVDMIQNIPVIYRNKSDIIANINELEPNKKVIDILNEPFEKLELSILSDFSEKRLFNGISELFDILEIKISQDIFEKFNSSELYNIIKIKIENLNIYVYRDHKEYFKLLFIEYNNNFIYEPKIKIGYNKTEIINLLGNPSSYSERRNIFIYISHKTGRQINIYFKNENVKLIQLISWNGI
jgi:hypothetical protein